jgi:hypothetical protein
LADYVYEHGRKPSLFVPLVWSEGGLVACLPVEGELHRLIMTLMSAVADDIEKDDRKAGLCDGRR